MTAGNNTYYSRSPVGVDNEGGSKANVADTTPPLRVHTFMLHHCSRYGHCNGQCVSNDVVMIVPQGLVVGVSAPATMPLYWASGIPCFHL